MKFSSSAPAFARLGALVLSLVSPWPWAFAAQSASGTSGSAASAPVNLEPVLVTADLWSSPLDRLPASVTVFDEAALRAGAVSHFGDLADAIPNFTWSGGTSRPRYFQIRGLGENSQYEGETPDSSVRFLVDDLDLTGLGSVAGAFDVRQVEVLRGPQAGAFGANAAGGLVRMVSNAPTPYWTGQVQGEVGGDSLRSAGWAVGGPLVAAKPELLMARLALHTSRSDGFRYNVTRRSDSNARDEFSARLRLTWNPTPDWRWEATGFFADFDNGYDEFALNNNGRLTFSDQPGRDRQITRAASLRGTLTGWPGVRLTTVTSFGRTGGVYSYDDDWTAASYQGFSYLQRNRSVWSEELRLDSSVHRGALGWIDRWTLGAYFSAVAEHTAYTNEDPGNLRGLRTDYAADNQALFGQVSHEFNPHTRLVVGLRVEGVDNDGRGIKTRYRKARGTFDPEIRFAPAFRDTLFGGKITLERDLAAGQLAFVSLTRGYKAGGINVDARISPPADPLSYGTETLWSYEAGVRGHGFSRRLTGELTVFLLERRDTQVRDSAGFGGNYRFFTANGRDARVSGLEASGAFSVNQVWSVFGSLSQMSSSLARFVLANGNAGGGRRLANTPPYGYALGVRYRDQDGFSGQVQWVGRGRQFDSNNQNEGRRPFQVVNASVGYTWRQWTFSVWGRNLGNERYEKRVFFFGNEDPDYVESRYEDRADPRQIGGSVAYRF